MNPLHNRVFHEIQDTKANDERIYTYCGLRKIDGIDISVFKNKFMENPIYVFRNELNKLAEENLIEVDENKIKLTQKGLDLANQVWLEFVN